MFCRFSLLNADDELHNEMDIEYRKLMKIGCRFMTSTSILNEVANSRCKPIVGFYKKLQRSCHVDIVFVNKNIWSSGWKRYEDRPDKELSLTDCISIIIMDDYGLMNVLTNDKHFKQAGFNTILQK